MIKLSEAQIAALKRIGSEGSRARLSIHYNTLRALWRRGLVAIINDRLVLTLLGQEALKKARKG